MSARSQPPPTRFTALFRRERRERSRSQVQRSTDVLHHGARRHAVPVRRHRLRRPRGALAAAAVAARAAPVRTSSAAPRLVPAEELQAWPMPPPPPLPGFRVVEAGEDDPFAGSEYLRRRPHVRHAMRRAIRAALRDADRNASADPYELLAQRLLDGRRGRARRRGGRRARRRSRHVGAASAAAAGRRRRPGGDGAEARVAARAAAEAADARDVAAAAQVGGDSVLIARPAGAVPRRRPRGAGRAREGAAARAWILAQFWRAHPDVRQRGGNGVDRQPRLLASRRRDRALFGRRDVGRALPRADAAAVDDLVRVELVGLWRLQEQDGDAAAVVLAPPLHVSRHRGDRAQRRGGRRRHVGALRLLPAAEGAAAAGAQPDLHSGPRADVRRPQRRLRLLPGLRAERAGTVGD